MTYLLRPGLVFLLVLQLCACGSNLPKPPPIEADEIPANQPVPRTEPLSEVGNHSPYRVNGRTYRVLPSAQGYVRKAPPPGMDPNFKAA